MKSRKVVKFISGISSVVIYGILIFMIFIVISSKVAGGTPKIFGYELMTVLSGSMEPGIKTGSVISVKPVDDPKKLKKGDVITFKASDDPNILITHRIIEVEKANSTVQYITQGDNNNSKDPNPVTPGQVVAKYNGFTIPYVGLILDFINSKKGAVFTMIIPGVLYIVYSIFSIWKTISRLETEESQSIS